MSVLSLPQLVSTRSRQPGWVGIDIGTSSIKLAQLESSRGRLHFGTRLMIPHGETGLRGANALPAHAVRSTLARHTSVKRGFTGRKAAAVLSMDLVDFRSLSLPSGTEAELELMVQEELGRQLGPDIAFEFWTAPDKGTTSVFAISVEANAAIAVAQDLETAGFACQSLDALPFALSRAAMLSCDAPRDGATAIIDWGSEHALIMIARRGTPLFSRLLRGRGTRTMVSALQTTLELSESDCWQLLLEYGIGQRANDNPVAQAIGQVAMEMVRDFVKEIQRTLSFAAQQLPQAKPERVMLFGGGATICGLAEHLQGACGMPVAPWRLHAATSNSYVLPDAIFGAAAGLSALGLDAERGWES